LPPAFVTAVVRIVVAVVSLLSIVVLNDPVAAVRAHAIAAHGAGAGCRRITVLARVSAAVSATFLAAFFITTVPRLDVAVVALLVAHGDAVAARRFGWLDAALLVTTVA
jgi:hypothetical protein